MRFSGILFDLDGTLVNTIPDLAVAANAMRRDMGKPQVSEATIASYVGKGDARLVARALDCDGQPGNDAVVNGGMARFLAHYRVSNGRASRVYPGVVAGLQAFRAAGAKLAVVTNKATEFTHPLLRQLDLVRFFDAIVCGDTCARRKPDPKPVAYACRQLGVDPEDALLIGDSINDALAGRAAGTRVLAVPYGYNEGHSAAELPVDGIVESVLAAAAWAQATTLRSA